MNCTICGKPLDAEPLAVDDARQAHSACLEAEQERMADTQSDAPILKRIGDWHVNLYAQHDTVLKYRAEATHFFDHEWAEGMDAEQALTLLAKKIGLPAREMLREFGLV